ncbi:unnamed protein product [Didymodactylos carnosus]|uniref:MULE transposase domain-containing protein n=2 Tax=Didymodactylos carnosus TaxID=1234261 RepID=A0A8S2HDL4_9BILA|nr:unnamed protein product [Didymodactylos carnosus]CAF3633454.1 unnamed protein product [Didymodactylos carnosus]
MVAVTRASAREQSSSNTTANTAAADSVGKKSVKKKKELDQQFKQSSASVLSVQSHETTTATSSILPATPPVSDTTSPQSSSLKTSFSAAQHEKLYDGDSETKLDTMTTWSIIVGGIDWCKTNRGNDRMCMGGYTYDFMSQSLKNNHRSFRCSKKNSGCRAVVHVFIDSNVYKNSNNVEHNHPPNPVDVKRLLVLQKIKERMSIEPTSIPRIIEDEYIKHNLNTDEQQHFLLPSAQASKFYKIRAKMLPPNPKSPDFEVPKLYSTTNNNEDFLIYDSTHKKLGGRLMIFSTKALIEILCDCDTILIDGTFKTRPILFAQVYVIMGKHLGEVIPLVWCLTSKRNQDVYKKIFNVLKTKANEFGGRFEPQYAYLDFEVGTINALENLFPDMSIRGCWYHYTQAIFRNIQKIGLVHMYEQNKEVSIWLKSFMALPLVKHNTVAAAIQLLIDNAPLPDNLLVEFIQYFEKQWVQRVPKKYWNLGPIHIRCNNAVEAYNNRLQHRFGIHPRLWSFIHFLKGEESLVMMRTTQIRSGNYQNKTIPFALGNQRARKKKKQLKNLSRLLELGTINLKQYLTSLSFFVGDSVSIKSKKNKDTHRVTTEYNNNIDITNDI